jgi:amino acid transporter
VVAALVLLTGYVLAAATVKCIFGSWTHDILTRNFSVSVPWPVLSVLRAVVFTAIAVRGLRLSTEAAVAFFAFEVLSLLAIALTVIFAGGQEGLSLAALSRPSTAARSRSHPTVRERPVLPLKAPQNSSSTRALKHYHHATLFVALRGSSSIGPMKPGKSLGEG